MSIRSHIDAEVAQRNPFSSRYVRPGALPYLFPCEGNMTALVERLERHDWRGEIVGPHGAGKSTLLAALIPAMEARGCVVRRIDLHDGERRLPPRSIPPRAAWRKTVLIIDGFEQLARWRQWMLRFASRRHEGGLLVTSHATVGLPRLCDVVIDARRAHMLLMTLLREAPAGLVTETDFLDAWNQHAGDLRSVWFQLYDLYELRRREFAECPKHGR